MSSFDIRTIGLRSVGSGLPMTVKWDDLRVGKKYHIPTVDEFKRTNVEIIGKFETYIRVIDLNNKSSFLIYCYDIPSKFMYEI